MPVVVALFAVTALLIAAPLAVMLQRARRASPFTYAVCLAACLAIMSAAGLQLLEGAGTAPALQLPVGLPWIGAHFRIDALSASFSSSSISAAPARASSPSAMAAREGSGARAAVLPSVSRPA